MKPNTQGVLLSLAACVLGLIAGPAWADSDELRQDRGERYDRAKPQRLEADRNDKDGSRGPRPPQIAPATPSPGKPAPTPPTPGQPDKGAGWQSGRGDSGFIHGAAPTPPVVSGRPDYRDRDGDWRNHTPNWPNRDKDWRDRDRDYRYYRPGPPVVGWHRPPVVIGTRIEVLPRGYRTVWYGGLTYFVYDDIYYRREADTYVVVRPPVIREEAGGDDYATEDDSDEEPYIYPNRGQDEKLQALDRYECHRWAVKQTGYDPTEPLGGVDRSETRSRRNDYLRAQSACLEGRGYTVR